MWKQLTNELNTQACSETTCVCVGDSEADIYELFLSELNEDKIKDSDMESLIGLVAHDLWR